MKPLIARWDTKTKRGTWPEVQVEFRHLHMFSFSNYNDPDPLWSCVIEKTSGDCWVFADDNFDGLREEERVLAGANRLEHPRYLRRDKVACRIGEPARLLLIPIAFQQRLQVVNGRNCVEHSLDMSAEVLYVATPMGLL